MPLPLQAQQPYPTNHPGPAWFVDEANAAHITTRNTNGSATAKKYIIEATGSGVAILDYDRDGWPDIFLVNGRELDSRAAPTSHLFHNNHDGTFTDVTAKAGLARPPGGRAHASATTITMATTTYTSPPTAKTTSITTSATAALKRSANKLA